MLYDRAFRQGGFTNVVPVPSQAIIDPEFPTCKKPNPEFRDVFNPGVELANEIGADMIVATDPDADRMGACVRTDKGDFQVLTGNQIATLMSYYLLQNLKESGKLTPDYEIVTSIVSSALPFKIAKDFGIKTKSVLTGFKYIGEEVDRMKKENDGKFLMGFEESYGYLFQPFARDKDAMQGALMFAEVASYYASHGMTVFDGLQEIWKKYGVAYEITRAIEMPGIGGQKKMAALMSKLRSEHLTEINGVKVVKTEDYQEQVTLEDGKETPLTGFPKSNVLKYFLEDETWVALRPSGTEPVIKAYVGVNKKDIETAEASAQSFQDAISELLK
jgi:phosphoglucomutase